MLLSIRGTHGSGKSTIVKTLLQRYKTESRLGPKGKPIGYAVDVPWIEQLIYVVGSYENACGGCDTIQPYSEIWPLIKEYAGYGHVIFEGALVSSSYGNIGRATEVYGDKCVFAFLDTPLEVCLQRIKQRREAKGNFKPLDPKNTEHKYNSVKGSIDKIRDVFKRRVVMLDYRRPVSQLLEILYHDQAQG